MKITQVPWIEIPATNFKRAVLFYKSVFGFVFEYYEFNGRRHAVYKMNATLSIAIVEHKEIVFTGTGPLIYFKIDSDMSLILESVVQYEGKIIQPKMLIRNTNSQGVSVIPKTLIDSKSGYFALISDSENHLLGLYSNS